MLRYDPSTRLSSQDCLLRSDVFNAASSSRVADGGGVAAPATGGVVNDEATGGNIIDTVDDKHSKAGGLGRDAQQVLSSEEERGREPGREGGKRPSTRTLPDELERPEETALVGEPGYVRKRVTEIDQIEEYFAKKKAGGRDHAVHSQGESRDSSCGDIDVAAVGLPQPSGAQLAPETQTPTASAQLPHETQAGTGRGSYESDSFYEDDDAMASATAALAATTSSLDAATALDATALGDTALDATAVNDTALDATAEDDTGLDATVALDATPPAVVVVSDDDDVDATSLEQRVVHEPSEGARPASPELVRYLDGVEVDEEGQEEEGEGGGDGWRVVGAFRVLAASGPGGKLAGRAIRRMLLSTSKRRQNQQRQQQRQQQQQSGL